MEVVKRLGVEQFFAFFLLFARATPFDNAALDCHWTAVELGVGLLFFQQLKNDGKMHTTRLCPMKICINLKNHATAAGGGKKAGPGEFLGHNFQPKCQFTVLRVPPHGCQLLLTNEAIFAICRCFSTMIYIHQSQQNRILMKRELYQIAFLFSPIFGPLF